MRIKIILDRFRWIKALFSPFTPFKISWYIGKTQVGVRYFLPRRWRRYTEEEAMEAAFKAINNESLIKKSFNDWFKQYRNSKKAVPLKIGFSSCSLGWKTKWDQYDIRHEWDPVISFVFFGYQIAMTVYHKHHSHYWESWLCYEYASDKKKSKQERINFCRRKCPQTWNRLHKDGTSETTDYWNLILKPKYLK